VTGWISVVDEHTPRNNLHIRIMRAGHSLIGGMYAETGDSIFGTFYIPEGKNLVCCRVVAKKETVSKCIFSNLFWFYSRPIDQEPGEGSPRDCAPDVSTFFTLNGGLDQGY